MASPLRRRELREFTLPLLVGIAFLGLTSCQPRPSADNSGATLHLAIASNLLPISDRLKAAFERQSGARLVVTSGSTGKLYTQVLHGAPFDILLAADIEHPKRLVAQGFAVEEFRFSYAIGRLALACSKQVATTDWQHLLRSDEVSHIAIANPETAPYGKAAKELLLRHALWDELQPKIVQGESIAQTFSFLHTGAADVGFVALAQLVELGQAPFWIVPAELHEALIQQAVLLRRAENLAEAHAFLTFLRGDEAQAILREAGYEIPD